MTKDKIPTTLAVRLLRREKADFTPFFYDYEEHGGTETAARALGVDEHLVIKTLVFQDEKQESLIMLMHGDKQVSTKNLARQLQRKLLEPCLPERVGKLTGYQVGGVSPFATAKAMPVYVEQSVFKLPCIYINGGKRGFLVKISPEELIRLLRPTPVTAAY